MKLINSARTSCVAVLVILTAGSAGAQTAKGDWELAFRASYSHTWLNNRVDVDTSLDIYNGAVNVGYFLTRGLEFGLGISVFGMDGDVDVGGFKGAADAWVVPVTIGLDYHFNTGSKLVPYLGGAAGTYVVGGGFDENWAVVGVMGDVHAGLKQFVKENVAIDYRVSFQYIPLPADVSLGTVSFSIGLSLFF